MMGEFFKGWRRKSGAMTLLMACVFTAGWVRSLTIVDSAISANRGTGYSLMSADGKIELGIDHDAKVAIPIRLGSQPLGTRHKFEELYLKRVKAARAQLANLEDAKATLSPRQAADLEGRTKLALDLALMRLNQPLWSVPYWSIVIPLTLIAFWLLLSKPRLSIQEKIAEPIPVKVE